MKGAYGTTWATEKWYRNNSDRHVAFFPVPRSHFSLGPKRTEHLPTGNFPADRPGTLVFVGRDGIDQVQFDLRLYNRANPHEWGTQLPVVREREFRSSLDLLNVPTSGDFRTALRIYGLPDSTHSEGVHVRIYARQPYTTDDQQLIDVVLTLHGWPLYAQILGLAEEFPEIRGADRVHVRIEAPANVKIWAFISVVSNLTQHVSLVTPD